MNLESGVMQIHIEDIIPNRFQPRLNFDEQGLKELSDSIKEHGIIQPLVLRKLGDKYEIIAGERRYKAAQMAGLTTVPAVIANVDDNTSAEVALVENVQRRDLTSIEEARSYKNLLNKGYLTQEQLAKRMGLSQPAIANKLRLLNLDEEVQQALLEEKISERHARTLLTLSDKAEQREWLHRIINERLTVRQLDVELKKAGIQKTEEKAESEPTTEVIEPENRTTTAFSTTTDDIETLDEIEPLESTDSFAEATTVPDFNVSTPNSISDIDDVEVLVDDNKENKFFNLSDTDTKTDDDFIDLQTTNISDITPEEPVVIDEPKKEPEPTYDSNDSINISSNNKFFTPVKADNEEEIKTEDDDFIDPMAVVDAIKNDINKPIEQASLKTAINDIRECVNKLGEKGIRINIDEIDKPDTYQITIDIEKDS